MGTTSGVLNPKKNPISNYAYKIIPLQPFILQPIVHFTPVVLLLAREEDSF
jgi:hypothetical protein